VVVHEWALNLNIGWETSIFKLLVFLSWCIIVVLKQHYMCLCLMLSSNNVQMKCSQVIAKFSDELEI
jgi:hypothetical protein